MKIEAIIYNIPYISISMLIPVIFSLLIAFTKEAYTKHLALISVSANFLLSLYMAILFDTSNSQSLYFYESYTIIDELNISLTLGLDGLSMLMFLLTTLVSLVAVVWSLRDKQINLRLKEYYIAFLLTESFLIGVFASWDLIAFYVFYELTLVPMFFVIGIWGYKLRLYSAYKFFIYIFVSSLFLLAGIVSTASQHYKKFGEFSFNYFDLLNNEYSLPFEIFLFFLFFIAFAVKTPIVPFHTWLPDAHGEAPTAGSVVLAAILLKMGTYALLRFNIGLFPEASKFLFPYLAILGIISIAYASWMTIVQKNIKRFVAYSSVSHMGFVVASMFFLNKIGFKASVIEMFAHGLTSASLFMIAGFVYNRLHTFNMDNLKGSVKFMPLFAIIVAITGFASMGLPGGSSFWGKFLTLMSAREHGMELAMGVLVGGFFSAVYVLYMLKTLFLDVKEESVLIHFKDVRGAKLLAFIGVIIPIFMVGFLPFIFFGFYERFLDFFTSNILNR